jgi:hypothetical protein
MLYDRINESFEDKPNVQFEAADGKLHQTPTKLNE